MKNILILAAVLLCCVGAEYQKLDPKTGKWVEDKQAKEVMRIHRDGYETGFRDALNAAMLHDLFLKMTETNQPWGARAITLCERHGVKPDPKWAEALKVIPAK